MIGLRPTLSRRRGGKPSVSGNSTVKLRMRDQASTNGVMIDYSGNGHHGWYGGVKKAAILDTVYGDRGLILPGISGNYLSTPDAAALRVTGDIDIRVDVQLADYTPSAAYTFVGKYVAPQAAYLLRINTSGLLLFSLSVDGTTSATATASAATGVTDGTRTWFRATWRQSDGRVQFFKSTDGVSWVQVGTGVTLAVASIFAGTETLKIGARAAGGATEPLLGTIYRAIIKNGIDGTTVLDTDDMGTLAQGTRSFVSSTGQTFTVNQAGSSTAEPWMLWKDGDAYMALPGTSGNYASVPDEAALAITDMAADALVAPNDITPAGEGSLIGQWPSVGQYSWLLRYRSDSKLTYYYSADGTTVLGPVTSTAALPTSDGQTVECRVALDADNGAGGADVSFWYRVGGTGAWVQLGTTVTVGSTIALHNSTGILEIGANNSGTNGLSGMTVFGGKLYSDTAAATTVLDIDFTDASAYNATQTELTAVTGQCVWENDTVLMSDGRVVRAADLVGTEFEMLGWNEKTGKATPRKAWADWNRKEPVYRLTTDSGREIVRNAHHPIWSANVRTRTSFRQDGKKYSGNAVDPLGWIGLADLRPGQAVLVPTEVKTKADKRIPFEDAALMGYIMGDGTSSGRSAVRFCQEDGEALDEFIQCVRSLGCDVRYDPDSGNARSVVVRGPHADGRSFEVADLDALTDHQRIVAEAVADGWSAPELADATGTTIQNIHQTINRCERNGGLAASPKRGEHAVQALTRKWGLQGVKHVDMEWPEEVWTLHPDDLAVVIGRFWACDGWASVGNSGQPEIAISQHNERVIRDLQRLLLRLGIASTLRTTETTHRDRWTLSVRTESMERFADVIHVTGKQDRVLACVAALASRTQPERWRSLDAPDGYRWERVRSVDMLPGEHWTVAIEVEHDHAWADLVVEHNTVTINRSSTGYKTTIVNENKIVFDGVNDYVEIDDHDRLDFGATESFTATAVWRTWATSAQVVLAKKAGGLASNVGWETFHNAVGGGVFIRIADGTNTSNDSDGSVVAGARVVHSGKRDVAGDYLKAYLSAVSSGQTTDATTGSMANSVALRIGSYSVGATFLGAEFIDFILHRRALSAGEITQLNRELA